MRDGGLGGPGGEQEPRVARARHVKEEDAVLPPQQAEQASTGEDVLVGREMAVVRLVADVARGRNGNGSEHFSIIIGVFVKVDDGKKVRGHAGLVAGPHIEGLGRPVLAIARLPIARERGSGEGQGDQKQRPDQGHGMRFVSRVHIAPLSTAPGSSRARGGWAPLEMSAGRLYSGGGIVTPTSPARLMAS